jgi:predicted metal-dependent hydrolase
VPAGDDRVFPSVPERDFVFSEDAWSEGMDYLVRDLPFHVHEVFEQRWRCAPEPERSTWQALAQWGAALTHHARGNAIGQHRIARRAQTLLESAEDDGQIPSVIDVDVVRQSLAQLA